MENLPVLQLPQLHLLVAGHSTRSQLTTAMIARLALRGSLLVLDGGNCFRGHQLARELRRHSTQLKAALQRVYIARAFTCYQVLTLLSSTPAAPVPTLALDLLSTFYDESVNLSERRRLLQACLGHLRRLSQAAPILVSAAPPKPREPGELLALLTEAADQYWQFQDDQPPTPPRLF